MTLKPITLISVFQETFLANNMEALAISLIKLHSKSILMINRFIHLYNKLDHHFNKYKINGNSHSTYKYKISACNNQTHTLLLINIMDNNTSHKVTHSKTFKNLKPHWWPIIWTIWPEITILIQFNSQTLICNLNAMFQKNNLLLHLTALNLMNYRIKLIN